MLSWDSVECSLLGVGYDSYECGYRNVLDRVRRGLVLGIGSSVMLGSY